MANLHDLLKQLPDDMILFNHASVVNREQKTVSEWLKTTRNEGGLELSDSKRNYGKETVKIIYAPNVGVIFSEVR